MAQRLDTALLRQSVAGAACKSPHAAVAAAVHTVLCAAGLTLASAAGKTATNNQLPTGWQGEEGSPISFVYRKGGQSVEVKLLAMGGTLLVHLQIAGQDSVFTCELNVDKYVNEGAPLDDADRLFSLDVGDLPSHLASELVDKAFPPARTRGDQGAAQQEGRSRDERQGERVRDEDDVDSSLRAPRRDPRMQPSPLLEDARNPLAVGDGDRLPPGLRGPGFYVGGGSGGGMYMGPGHPAFGGVGGLHDPGPASGFPRGTVPPGARFDPVGPFGQPHPNRGPGRAFGAPDPDHLPPPGYGDMFM